MMGKWYFNCSILHVITYLPTADLHRTVSVVLEQMGDPIPSTSGRLAPQRHPLGPERPTGDVRVLDELDRRPSPRRGPYMQTPHPDRRYDDRPTQGGHLRDYRPDESGLRGARPYDDRCDYRGDRALTRRDRVVIDLTRSRVKNNQRWKWREISELAKNTLEIKMKLNIN